ncbi:MAG: hypothetical protein DRG78_11205 [Epsilonproteobacteria bacterium]|nr:MAG: hypothetical protein DRG78_11205 [Campylobacterota bacterium]
MINILIVEDEKVASIMLNKYIQKYFAKNDIENFQIDIAENGLEAVSMAQDTSYSMIFLDVVMPKLDGLGVLDNIRIEHKNNHQPYVCMTTGLGKEEDKLTFHQKGASSYAIKPYSRDTIYLMLDKYIKPLLMIDETTDDEFKDFDDFEDFDEFTDFYDEDEDFDIDTELMDEHNKSHKQIPASEFLKDFNSIEYMLEDLEDVSELLSELITSIDAESMNDFKEDIECILNKYKFFLDGLHDFDELSSSLSLLNNSVSNIDFKTLDSKKAIFAVEFIKAIFIDLSEWKEHVFIKKDAVDVFYVNASVLNSCIQLQNFIKR